MSSFFHCASTNLSFNRRFASSQLPSARIALATSVSSTRCSGDKCKRRGREGAEVEEEEGAEEAEEEVAGDEVAISSASTVAQQSNANANEKGE